MMCIGGIIMAYSKDAKLTLVLAVAIPVLVLAIVIIARSGMPLNQIIVLDEGKIAGVGSHRDLMESSGVYREIVMSQLS